MSGVRGKNDFHRTIKGAANGGLLVLKEFIRFFLIPIKVKGNVCPKGKNGQKLWKEYVFNDVRVFDY